MGLAVHMPASKIHRRLFLKGCLGGLLAAPGLSYLSRKTAHASSMPAARRSALQSIRYLNLSMDKYHNRFPVYDDLSSVGNHFHALAKIPDGSAAVTIQGGWNDRPHTGATVLRCEFTNTTGNNFGGFYFLNGVLPSGATAPGLNFGDLPNAGINLSGATALTFWARGESGGERINLFMGGVGWPVDPNNPIPTNPFPDSARVVKISVKLKRQWTKYRINLANKNLSYVLGGFGWDASAQENPLGALFYIDDIQYELSPASRENRLDQPRFIRSFTTLPTQPDIHDGNQDDDIDFVLRNTAFAYDNALAILAYLADGSAGSLRRAILIGDAFVYAAEHDRTFDDGRIRSAYAAGDISLPPGWTPNGRVGTAPIPGFYDESQQTFFEVEQTASDTGNNAWVMIALLALYKRFPKQSYLTEATRIGNFIRTLRNDNGTYRGFLGGFEDPESATPTMRSYASTEHNLDCIAAFTVMAEVSGDASWLDDAAHARQFVDDMWDPIKACYLAGTLDPDTLNMVQDQLPLDVQAWSTLVMADALTQHPEILASAEQHHRTVSDGFSGFDFNEDNDGVWFEGTAQMAVAYSFANPGQAAEQLRQTLRRAQRIRQSGGISGGLPAASHDAVSTGFGFKLFRRQHVGATAWNVFAQLGFNPYYQTKSQS